jgi:hypothetical protein
VKELLEAAIGIKSRFLRAGAIVGIDRIEADEFVRLLAAIVAFDPPKPKQYTMESWEEFVKGKEQIWLIGPDDKSPCGVRLRKNGLATFWRDDYDALRELTAKD